MAEFLPGHAAVLIAAIIMIAVSLLALHWAWRTGQFDDVEEPKYRMMEGENQED